MTISRLVFSLGVLALAGPAIAQQQPSIEDLRERVAELEREIREISRRLSATDANGNATSESEPADVAVVERIDELDQRLRIQTRQDELRRESDAERLKTAPAVGAGREGFQLRSADGSFQLRLRGLAHSDGRFFADGEGDPAADTFLMRRVRPIVDVTMSRTSTLG